jgi:4-carboxymuconolactone decarboxylase
MKLLAAALASLSLLAHRSRKPTRRKCARTCAPLRPRWRSIATTRCSASVEAPRPRRRDRSIVTLAALVARNQTAEMPFYLGLALDNGVKPAEISELITHLAFYSGWGSAMAAIAAHKDVFAQRKIGADQLPPASPPLLALNEAAEADRAKRVGDLFGATFPACVQYTTDVLFRDLWLRPGLAPRDRSLVTISALTATGQVAQLTGHANIGMNNGLTQTEIAEAITHLAFYVGWPNVFSAMPVAKDVFDKRPR